MVDEPLPNPTPNRTPELLAPAGGPEALAAAVAGGADAVYLGLGALNARRGAENFDTASLTDACRHAHLHATRVYLTANVLIHDDELPEALAMVDDAWAAGVDAVIVQDLGLLRALRRHLPQVRVHASTQLGAHNLATVRTLSGLSVSRVTLARETSIGEMALFAARGGVEIETFVHGSLCYCYSGQCLMSSMIGGRSANRGLCAQPCRLPYALVDARGAAAEVPGRYLLSPKDLAGITQLPELLRSGVSALKIEGRMKSPEYVALVTAVYRAALDRAAADPDTFEVLPAEWEILEEAFNRGFTEGCLTGRRGADFMSWKRPNNRGVPVGRVASVDGDRAVVSLDRSLAAADQVEFWTGSGRFGQTTGQLTLDGRAVERAPAGSKPSMRVTRRVGSGDRVFRVLDADLTAAARRTFTGPDRRPASADIAVIARIGEALRVTMTAGGVTGSAEGPLVEPARTKALTADEIIEHAGRLGGTVYAAGSWDVSLDSGAGGSFSTLHDVRRRAVEALDAARLAPWSGRAAAHDADWWRGELGRPDVAAPDTAAATKAARAAAPRKGAVSAGPLTTPALVVVTGDLETAGACLDAGADRVLLDVTRFGRPPEALPDGVEPLLPRIAHDDEIQELRGWIVRGAPVTVDNLGVLTQAFGEGAQVTAGWPLNVANAMAARALADLGATALWASPELSGRRLAALVAGSPVPVGALVLGPVELMVAENCVLTAVGPCSRQCASCDRRRGARWLRDEKGYRFPVWTDLRGRTHLANSVPLDLTRALPEMLAAGVSMLRMELGSASRADAAKLTAAVRGRLRSAVLAVDAGAEPPAQAVPVLDPSTSGHFFRGVR